MCVFSVIIPTYNREKIISRAIKSILEQTFSDFELIIVDDGSVDETKKVVESFKDDRIVYLYKENGGQNSALNKGLEYAKGEYIAFCDSDDEWLPTKLEKCYNKYLEDDEVSVVYHQTGNEVDGNIVLARNDSLAGWIHKEVIIQGYLTSPTFLTCKRACFDTIGPFDVNIITTQDDDLCFNLTRYFKVGLVNEILGIYHTDISDRLMCQSEVAAESYYALWKKHKEDAISVGGAYKYSQKLLETSNRFRSINRNDRAKAIFEEAKTVYPLSTKDQIAYFLDGIKIRVNDYYWKVKIKLKM